jgi:nicotinamide-nucleotide amidase
MLVETTAELISIGNELLSGRTLNTHGKDLGAALSAIGLKLVRDTTIADELETIGHAVDEALARVDLVFVSGGLGPTVDDITRDALAKLLIRKVVLDQPTAEYLREWYGKRGRTITPAATRQAMVLEHAVVLPNSVGAAPGQRIELPEGKILFVMPGPPNEFNAILNEEILPWLKARYTDARPNLVRIIQTKGIGESDIVTILEHAGFQPANIDLGFYPGKGKVEIRLTALPDHESDIEAATQSLRSLLCTHLDPDA